MKKLILFTIAILFTISSYSQEIDAEDRVNITQSTKPFIGVYTFGYQGLPTPGYPQFQLNNYGGVPGSETATQDNSILGMFAFSGRDSIAKKTVGVIRVKTMEDFANSLSSRMDFLIGANKQQRMTILGDSGNVGIGTVSPTEKLDVNGKIRMEEGAMEGYVPVSDSMGVMTWTDPTTFTPQLWEENIYGIHKLNGNVGIGTETPVVPLHINSTYGATAYLESSSTNNYLTFKTNGSLGYIGVWSGDHDMDFGTDFGNTIGSAHIVTNASPKLTVIPDGNVGIGTQVPTTKLDVVGQIRMQEGAMEGYVPVSDSLGVMTWTDPTSFETPDLWKMNGANVYRDTGYVGIGTETPYVPLHIKTNLSAPFFIETTSNYNYWTFNTNGNYGYIGAYNAPEDMDFGTDLGNNTGSTHLVTAAIPRLTVIPDGKVGIGTQAPNNGQLTVVTNATATHKAIVAQTGYQGNMNVVGIESSATPASGYGYGMISLGGYLGVRGIGESNDYTGAVYGLSGFASGTGGVRYGVLGDAEDGTVNYAGYFIGNVNVTGTFTNPSDQKMKENIQSYKDALDIIQQLEAKTYDYKQGAFEGMNLPNQNQIGFIAQEVEKILPNLVTDNVHPEEIEEDENGKRIIVREAIDYKGVNYVGLIPVLTQGIKELSMVMEEKDKLIVSLLKDNETMKIELVSMTENINEMKALVNSMNDKFNQMEEDMSSCCFNDSEIKMGNTNIELNGSDRAILEQNSPNPFNEQTIIKYYIPSFVQKSILTITDVKGVPLKSVDLGGIGFGTVIINANELPAGIYIYTLFVDGRQVESKQMVLVK